MEGSNLTARENLDSSKTGISRKSQSPRGLGSFLALPAVALFAVLAMVVCNGAAAAGMSSGASGAIISSGNGFSGPSGGGIVPASWNNGRFLGLGSVTPSESTGPGICGTSAIPLSSESCRRDEHHHDLDIGANGCGPDVYVDQDFVGEKGDHKRFDTITIEPGATLCFPDRSVKVEVSNIAVLGTLQIGQQDHPVGMDNPLNHVTLEFFGDKNSKGVKNSGCVDPVSDEPFKKGIEVCKGGSLEMYGIKGVPKYSGTNWTYLSFPAGPPNKYGKVSGVTVPVERDGKEVLYVAKDVATGAGAWQKGDWIAVGGTGFSPFDTEIVKIATIVQNPTPPTGAGATGAAIYLDSTPLTHYHFGGPAPTPSKQCEIGGKLTTVACSNATECTDAECVSRPSALNYGDDSAQNYGVDERAPVALISRSIKLTALTPKNHPHWGGELKFLPGFSEVSIQGVELQKFGKDHLGSYPIHFHMDGNVEEKPLVDSNTIDHSYNHCITVHATQNLTVSNNVCVRIVGSMFYEEIGTETNTTFEDNLGMGAMSYDFNINGPEDKRKKLIKDYWWTGDYMTNNPGSAYYIDYDGFDVPDMDNRTNPIHGSCGKLADSGLYTDLTPVLADGKCPHDKKYLEPAGGFWITNPTTNLIGNVIDGCQGSGIGYWYLTPEIQPADSPYKAVSFNQYLPVGTFENNRVTGCYDGLFDEPEGSVKFNVSLLHPMTTGTPAGENIIAKFDGLTATRNRDRGVWLRDQWFVIDNGRFATNRDSATLLTAGGIDGGTPGDWMLVENSVFEGMSQNNVDRFGPCPISGTSFEGQEPKEGCIAETPKKGGELRGGDVIGKGYPDPRWNTAGYMIYDGPARLRHDRFVNFNDNPKPQMTRADVQALDDWAKLQPQLVQPDGTKVAWQYEGDAALGWFQSNQSSYPTLTNSEQLSFVNSTLRHQIYTESVNLGSAAEGFQDGDKNTSILDLDGTLSGFTTSPAPTNFESAHPISLNNLMFNASGNSVDECDSEGAQDTILQDRPTSLMTAASMATLEFQALWPTKDGKPLDPDVVPSDQLQKQTVTFENDYLNPDFGKHFTMALTGRNAIGVWEPKVTSGYGYTITAAPIKENEPAGIPDVVDVGVIDAVKPNISPASPFYVRVGICYTNATGGHPQNASDFKITRGYHAYGGGTIGPSNQAPAIRKYWNQLWDLYQTNGKSQRCWNLDGQNASNLLPDATHSGCPANGISLRPTGGSCPDGTTPATVLGQASCVWPTNTLTEASSLSAISNANGSPTTNGLKQYYYDPKTGWLFFYVAQEQPNPVGPSPLGSCGPGTPNSAACPNTANKETYYVCPAQGCDDYVVKLNDSSYQPGESACGDPYTDDNAAITKPEQDYELAYVSGDLQGQTVVRAPAGAGTKFPHYKTDPKQVCP